MMGRVFAALTRSLLIVAIFSPHASAEVEACGTAPASMGAFDTGNAGAAASAEPFFEDGERERRLSDHRGRGVVLNFWATWCAPCVEEMPALDRLSALLADGGIDVLALSEDFQGVKAVKPFYAKHGIETLAVLIDKRGQLVRSLGTRGLPTTVLYDAEGREVGRVVGPAEWDAPETVAFLRACLSPRA